MPSAGPTSGHRLYTYPTCGTCPPPLADLRRGMEQLGRARLFNTSGKSYRALGSLQVKAMDDERALSALAADGLLIKRPFLITAEGSITTGFRPEEWEQLLGTAH